jgi:hypothetical protein
MHAKGFALKTDSRLTTSKDATQRTFFMRPNAEFSKAFTAIGGLRMGWIFDGEERRIEDIPTDTLSRVSTKYDDHRVYLQTPDTSDLFLRVQAGQRTDRVPVSSSSGEGFVKSTVAHTINLMGALQGNALNRLSWNATYRKLNISDTSFTSLAAEESYLGRVEYGLNLWKGLVRSTTLYEVGSVRELKREYTFLEVPVGQGTHIWNDNNHDSLQQIYEFEVASDLDLLQANYVRILTPTTEYIDANAVTFNNVFHLDPSGRWRSAKGLLGVLAKLSTSAYVQINRKVLDEAGLSSVNPFADELPDTLLVSSATMLRNTLYFNRTAPTFGAEFNVSDNSHKQILTYGAEGRHRTERYLRTRLNIGKSLNVQLQLTSGRQSSSTPAFPVRDYDFTVRQVEPKLTYQQKSAFRVSLEYGYSVKQNSVEFESEKAMINEATAEARYTRVSRTALTSRLTYAAISFDGDAESSLGYAMLAGLRPGNNFVWNVTLEKTLANSFQLGLSYDGRKSDNSPFIHVGSVQARAVF